ncbi:hypothetical protein H632_c178p1 [Helicosporidium sp. ATCC 50920]|nr:hypothetical protein H632_c178p1 [Helicosporidium sp. ATCC 50920]|eukprot:KDD76572.1 hypothetical protein H632_c178p1 [Helicosporidium sp. ATCC 50920]
MLHFVVQDITQCNATLQEYLLESNEELDQRKSKQTELEARHASLHDQCGRLTVELETLATVAAQMRDALSHASRLDEQFAATVDHHKMQMQITETEVANLKAHSVQQAAEARQAQRDYEIQRVELEEAMTRELVARGETDALLAELQTLKATHAQELAQVQHKAEQKSEDLRRREIERVDQVAQNLDRVKARHAAELERAEEDRKKAQEQLGEAEKMLEHVRGLLEEQRTAMQTLHKAGHQVPPQGVQAQAHAEQGHPRHGTPTAGLFADVSVEEERVLASGQQRPAAGKGPRSGVRRARSCLSRPAAQEWDDLPGIGQAEVPSLDLGAESDSASQQSEKMESGLLFRAPSFEPVVHRRQRRELEDTATGAWQREESELLAEAAPKGANTLLKRMRAARGTHARGAAAPPKKRSNVMQLCVWGRGRGGCGRGGGVPG